MTIGLLNISLYIEQSHSLKEKRMALEGLKKRLRNRFNISVLETDKQDKWQRADLAIVLVSKTKANAHALLSGIVNFISLSHSVEIIDYHMELF